MKRIIFIIVMCYLPLFFLSCSNKDDPEAPYNPTDPEEELPYIDTASVDIRVNAHSQSVEIVGTTNAQWSARSFSDTTDDNWIGAPFVSIDGSQITICFTISENLTSSSRSGLVVLDLLNASTWSLRKDIGHPTFVITQAAAEP
ncbi:MAG: hypothetical protein K5856_02915 [Bacteroidaceae bacterium]|nr:hypothetical protein [Bacteroidaceae bacterium]